MRKLLLGTTAVVGAALIGATTASAQEAPTVRIGGYFDFSLGYVNDPADGAVVGVRGARTRFDYRTDTEIHVLVQGKAANGLTYGARVEFEMDATETTGAGSPGTVFRTDEIWGFASSPTLGTLRFGDTDSAAGVMQVRPPRYVGFNGPRVNWVQQGGTRYMFAGINDGADNSKIVYLSPQFAGFDFGLSFALNEGEGERITLNGGEGGNNLHRSRLGRENELTGALRYRGTFGGVGIAAGFAFSTANAAARYILGGVDTNLTGRTQNPTAYSLGLSASFSGVTVGGEYTWGRYTGSSPGNAGPRRGFGDARHWLLGASYAIPGADTTITANFGRGTQPTCTAAAPAADPGLPCPALSTFTHSSRILGLGATYTLAPGWTLYAYYENVRDRNFVAPAGLGAIPPGLNNRTTSAFVIGTSLTF